MWWKITIYFIAITVLVMLLHAYQNMEIKDAATLIGVNLTAISIYLAFLSIRETHEWNRRNLTLQLMGNWNQQTRPHLDTLIEAFPDFSTRPKYSDSDLWADNSQWVHPNWSMPEQRANEIICSMGKININSEDKKIYTSLISLINYFESLASAYQNHVVDRKVIEESFAPMIIDVCRYFRPFLITKRAQAGREPWPPLAKVVDIWEHDQVRIKAENQAKIAAERAKNARKRIRKISWENLKKYTGI